MRGRNILLGAVAGVLLAGTASAADLPTRKGAPAPYVTPPAVFSWTGAYIGAFAGGNWSRVTPHDLRLPGFTGDPVLNSNGLTAGGLAGYNWAFNSFIVGGEMEAGYDRRSASADFLDAAGAPRNVTMLGSAEGRVRGRIGYAWGSVMLFGAGGATAQDLKLTYTNLNTGFQQEITHWRGGFNVGGGLEWAFNDHWILRGEYIYDGFQARGYNFGGANFDSRSAKMQESTARAAIAYKF